MAAVSTGKTGCGNCIGGYARELNARWISGEITWVSSSGGRSECWDATHVYCVGKIGDREHAGKMRKQLGHLVA